MNLNSFFTDAMHEMLHCHDKPALQVIFVAEGAFETFLKYLHQVAVSTFISHRNRSKAGKVECSFTLIVYRQFQAEKGDDRPV